MLTGPDIPHEIISSWNMSDVIKKYLFSQEDEKPYWVIHLTRETKTKKELSECQAFS